MWQHGVAKFTQWSTSFALERKSTWKMVIRCVNETSADSISLLLFWIMYNMDPKFREYCIEVVNTRPCFFLSISGLRCMWQLRVAM